MWFANQSPAYDAPSGHENLPAPAIARRCEDEEEEGNGDAEWGGGGRGFDNAVRAVGWGGRRKTDLRIWTAQSRPHTRSPRRSYIVPCPRSRPCSTHPRTSHSLQGAWRCVRDMQLPVFDMPAARGQQGNRGAQLQEIGAGRGRTIGERGLPVPCLLPIKNLPLSLLHASQA
jgi:hypothetical protein